MDSDFKYTKNVLFKSCGTQRAQTHRIKDAPTLEPSKDEMSSSYLLSLKPIQLTIAGRF